MFVFSLLPDDIPQLNIISIVHLKLLLISLSFNLSGESEPWLQSRSSNKINRGEVTGDNLSFHLVINNVPLKILLRRGPKHYFMTIVNLNKDFAPPNYFIFKLGSLPWGHLVLEYSSPLLQVEILNLLCLRFLFAMACRHHLAFFLSGWFSVSLTLLPPLHHVLLCCGQGQVRRPSPQKTRR